VRQPGERRHRRAPQRSRLHQLEARGAFELAGGLAAGVGIEAALAGLAQVAGRQRCGGLVVDLLAAVLLDEDAVDRRLVVAEGQVLALPVVAPEARVQEVAQ
jgi:hypothetical protein